MATTVILHRWKYDVFVSFRGEDIRKSFIDHLFNDFKQKGIYAFRDDTKLPKGEEISPHLYKAIEESRFLIVFSKNYASSSWCLRELVKILQCKQMGKPKHEVQIIFYNVKPDVVRKQMGSNAEAFAKHQVSNRPEVDNWKKALSMAANLSGWDLEDMTNGYEYKFIDSISREILKKLCDRPLDVGEKLVGIDIHLDKLDLSRFIGSDKVNMIGICGISGIGKTTLAKAIYNLMYVHFQGSCFCEDVKEVTKCQGLIQVQLHMIGQIMKVEDLNIPSVAKGAMVIKKRMACKPILLVLDDVDDHKQLDSLFGSASWFCPGSLIIFTGKDKQLLRSHGVDEILHMDFLDENQSLQLFSSCAFKTKDSSRGFEKVSKEVVKYVQGHPLALKVLGRFLYGKTVSQWVSELDQLKVHPNKEIQQVFHLSYDGLNNQQQNILLDIACSFIGVNSNFAASVLDCCNFFADANIQVLVDKSLITISSNNSLQMHDLIQAMAREIVFEESCTPGNRSRLWVNPSEIYNILSENQATQVVEILDIRQKKSSQKFDIDGKAFARMKNLRILKLPMDDAVNFSGRLDFLSNKLRLLYWHGCSFKLLPSDFYPENIVVIDLSYSNIKQLWTTPKCLRRLKIMKLRHCCNLTTTPDFSEITNLVELNLEGCVNLVTVHPSIGMLKRLVVLNMRDCRRARSFPSKVEMDSLQVLNLSGCLNVNQLPEAFWSRWWTSIPGFIWNQRSVVSLAGLHMLKDLNLSYCNLVQVSESIGGLSCLEDLNLSYCNLEQVPESIGNLSCLEDLDLKGNNFTTLPGSFSQLSSLGWLYVNGCKKLEVLPKLPPSLREIDASDCTSLRSVSLAGLHMLEDLNLRCCNLEQVPDAIGGLSCLENLDLEGNNFTSLPVSLSQLSNLQKLILDGCKKLEVLPELPHSLETIKACGCTSLCSIRGSNPIMSKRTYLSNCPQLFKNLAIDSQVSISETQCHESSVTSQGSTNRFSSFLRYARIQNNRCGLFPLPGSSFENMDIIYNGNSIPNWFTNKSMGNHVKVELPLDWSLSKFRGYGTCVVFKRKEPSTSFGYSVKNFDGAFLGQCHPDYYWEYFKGKPIRIDESDMIWLHYSTHELWGWMRAKNFVTFCFEENEDIEVKEMGVRVVCDQEAADLSMFQDLPTLSQHGGALCLFGDMNYRINWSW